MFQRRKRTYTPEEYLASEEKADYKSEYYDGEIFAMAGGSYNHNIITGNIYAALHQFLAAKPCTVFTSDMRLLVEQNGLYTYPDVMVICGQARFVPNRTDTIANPVFIAEVLSKSTQEYDRGFKFESYRSLDSFQDYLLIDQERIHLEYYHKQADDQWLLTELKSTAQTLNIRSISFEIPISQIYQKVDWFAA